jgi:hypothetical protein
MNITATTELIPTGARFAIAAAVAAALAVAWIAAEHESHDAVVVAGTAMKAQAVRVTLPAVEIVGRRSSGGKIAA